MANKMYIVYTSQGFTQDNDGKDVDNIQILDFIDTATCKKEGINNTDDAANYAKFKMICGDYGNFTSLCVVSAKTDYCMRSIKK